MFLLLRRFLGELPEQQAGQRTFLWASGLLEMSEQLEVAAQTVGFEAHTVGLSSVATPTWKTFFQC